MPSRRFARRLKGWLLFAAVVAVPGASPPARAESLCDGCILTLQFENDYFGNRDGHFSHGTRAALLAPALMTPDWINDTMGLLPWVDPGTSRHVVFSLGQSIFTPDDITQRALIPDDRPYAGWLHAGVGLVWVNDTTLDNLEVDVGIVGRHSFAEDVQKTWHKVFGFTRPQGWDNQIRDEPGLMLTYERNWRRLRTFSALGLDGDITPHLGASIGNVLTQGAAGLTVRIGSDLSRNLDYGPPRIRPSLPGSDFFVQRGAWSWYLFAGVEGRAVARNIFLDGNSFRKSHSVDKKPFVGDIQAGIALIIGSARLAYTHVLRSKEFDGQDHTDQFGAVSLSVRF